MKKLLFLLALSIPAINCGDDSGGDGATCATGTTLVNGECQPDINMCGPGTTLNDTGVCEVNPTSTSFVQVEHLARPGINEALLFTAGFNDGYNATAPSFKGAEAAVPAVTAEAKTVLKAIYLGSCLVSGALNLTPGAGGTALKPGLVPCTEVGGSMFVGGDILAGTTLVQTTKDQADVYANRMFAQFIPDVMRIDTAVASNYLTPCDDPTAPKQLLCGGRRLDDDVIDVTYNYLIGGLAGTPGPRISANATADQVRAVTSDGVAFDTAAAAGAGNNKNGLTDGVAANSQQDHKAPTNEFPYSAPPF